MHYWDWGCSWYHVSNFVPSACIQVAKEDVECSTAYHQHSCDNRTKITKLWRWMGPIIHGPWKTLSKGSIEWFLLERYIIKYCHYFDIAANISSQHGSVRAGFSFLMECFILFHSSMAVVLAWKVGIEPLARVLRLDLISVSGNL